MEAATQRELLALAREAVERRVRSAEVLPVPSREWSAPLLEPGASFVTLTLRGELRGCCGSIEPRDMLAGDVWRNAQRSACEDPRFPPLAVSDAAACALEIAVLGPLEPIDADSEQALLAALRPRVDGVLMSLDERRATFLPKVWEKLPEPEQFLRHLKHKMGLSLGFWDPRLRFHRYATQEFSSETWKA